MTRWELLNYNMSGQIVGNGTVTDRAIVYNDDFSRTTYTPVHLHYQQTIPHTCTYTTFDGNIPRYVDVDGVKIKVETLEMAMERELTLMSDDKLAELLSRVADNRDANREASDRKKELDDRRAAQRLVREMERALESGKGEVAGEQRRLIIEEDDDG